MSLLLRQFLYSSACKLRQRHITDIIGMTDNYHHSTGMTHNRDTMLLRMIEISCFELFRTTSFTTRHVQVGTLSDTCYWYITSCRYTTGVYRPSFMFYCSRVLPSPYNNSQGGTRATWMQGLFGFHYPPVYRQRLAHHSSPVIRSLSYLSNYVCKTSKCSGLIFKTKKKKSLVLKTCI